MTHSLRKTMLLMLELVFTLAGATAHGANTSDIAQYGDQNKAHGLSEGNPIVPGLFADPSLAKFGDTFYLYSTTDGFGWETGRWVAWKSKDFVHWSFKGESFPEITGQENWAPGKPILRNKRYWMPFSWRRSGNYLAVADRPEGPFHFANGGKKLTDSIDCELFVDDDGTPYVIYGGTHVYIQRLKPDLSGFDGPGTEVDYHKGYVEGPFLFKRGGKYYACAANLGYAEYRIIYGISDKIEGPYTFPKDNIIIAPVPADHLWGTGHGNILRLSAKADDWVLIYLRSRMGERVDPFQTSGNVYRQVCAERLHFNADGTIQPIIPSRHGVGLLARSADKATNLALGKPATASSSLPRYEPGKANDGSFGTRWIVGAGTSFAPTAETRPAHWRWITEKPADDWTSVNFDASQWRDGVGGFGTADTPGAIVGTAWTTSDLWLRQEFTLSASNLTPDVKPQLRVHHDDACEVFLNGVSAATLPGFVSSYQTVALAPAARAALKPGRNVLAVHCHQDSGGQFIDAGLTVATPPWWQVDLGKPQRVARTEISFNYPTEITPYVLEWSTDGNQWHTYADHRRDTVRESPKVDRHSVTARFLRVRFPAAVTNSIPVGLWEFKAFDKP